MKVPHMGSARALTIAQLTFIQVKAATAPALCQKQIHMVGFVRVDYRGSHEIKVKVQFCFCIHVLLRMQLVGDCLSILLAVTSLVPIDLCMCFILPW